jgi:hypothetical protein
VQSQKTTGQIVTATALAQRLSVGVVVVNRLRREGRIPFLVVGGQARYEIEAVLAALRRTARYHNVAPSGADGRD